MLQQTRARRPVLLKQRKNGNIFFSQKLGKLWCNSNDHRVSTRRHVWTARERKVVEHEIGLEIQFIHFFLSFFRACVRAQRKVNELEEKEDEGKRIEIHHAKSQRPLEKKWRNLDLESTQQKYSDSTPGVAQKMNREKRVAESQFDPNWDTRERENRNRARLKSFILFFFLSSRVFEGGR